MKLVNLVSTYLSIHALFLIAQIVMLSINPAAPVIFNYDDSTLQNYDTGDYVVTQELSLPDSVDSISTEGNFFTDLWATIKNWVNDSQGAKYVKAFVSGPFGILSLAGVPPVIVFVFQAMWHGTFIIVLITWMRGGDA